jgi:hypothetical protein
MTSLVGGVFFFGVCLDAFSLGFAGAFTMLSFFLIAFANAFCMGDTISGFQLAGCLNFSS